VLISAPSHPSYPPTLNFAAIFRDVGGGGDRKKIIRDFPLTADALSVAAIESAASANTCWLAWRRLNSLIAV